MPRYILLIKAGPFGAANMLATGREGALGAMANLETLGVSNIVHYPVLGEYDLVLMADFTDDAACLAASLLANTEGYEVEQLKVFSLDELDQARQKLEAMGQKEAPSDTEPSEAGT